MLLESLTRLKDNEARFREILFVLGKYGLSDWLGNNRAKWLRKYLVSAKGQRLDQLQREERIRLALLELGTTFIKLGQMLSTRPDMVGPALAVELSKLQSGTPADPIDVVRATIQAELGKPIEELFQDFQPVAMASASIGQVHRAKLKDGTEVVVKVQHSGIEAKIHRDLDLLHGLAELAHKYVPALRNYRPVNTVREFRRTLLRELDMTAERRNLEEFARHFTRDETVRIPKVYAELSSRRVLTMDLLDGVLGSKAQTVKEQVDLTTFARRAATMYLNMIFRDGFYHADPHPGNYLILPGGVVGVLDCGMVGRLDEELRDEIEATLLAVVERDTEVLVERVVKLGAPPPDLDRAALRADLAEFVAEYGSRSIQELDLGAALGEVVDIVARYQILLPSSASLLLRTLILLEGSAWQLDPAFNLMDLMAAYQARSVGRKFLRRHWLRNARRTAASYQRLLRALPDDVADILHRFRVGTFELEHEHRHLQASVHRLVEGLLSSALFLSSALLLSRGENMYLHLVPGFSCLAVALVLGVRLIRSIHSAEADRRE